MKFDKTSNVMKRNWRATVLLFIVFGLLVLTFERAWQVPHFSQFKEQMAGSDRALLDREGQKLQHLRINFKKKQGQWLDKGAHSENLIHSILQIEDRRFYWHWGVDPLAFARSFWVWLRWGKKQGGSTLTMQLVNLWDSERRGDDHLHKGTLYYKLRQVFYALIFEFKWKKEQILEAYLNLVPLRGETRGVGAFTESYWGKTPIQLNSLESWLIAYLIQYPSQSSKRLQSRVCTKLLQHNNCSPEFFELAKRAQSAKTHHQDHLLRFLVQKNPEIKVFKSFLDPSLQKRVESILTQSLARLQRNKVHDAAALVIENKTGRVVAYVGSARAQSQNSAVDGVQALRPVGSTLKPFFYGRAIEKKQLTAASLLEDVETAFRWEGGLYRPLNYDKRFRGTVTLRQALASSLNVPAVKVVSLLGLKETYNMLSGLNFSDLKNPDFYGASVALGAVEVRLAELTNAYRALARGGEWTELNWAENSNAANRPQKQILSKEVSFILSDILSDHQARRLGFHFDNALETPFWTAVKTGTSKDIRDNWCIGFSSDYTVGVWAGNFDGSPMREVSGVSGAGPAWNKIMSFLHRNKRSTPPEPPISLIKKTIQVESLQNSYQEYFISGTEPLDGRIEKAPVVSLKILFPVNGSELAIDPRRNQKDLTLFVRTEGVVHPGDKLYWNFTDVGALQNPHKIKEVKRGQHQFEIKDKNGKTIDTIFFKVK